MVRQKMGRRCKACDGITDDNFEQLLRINCKKSCQRNGKFKTSQVGKHPLPNVYLLSRYIDIGCDTDATFLAIRSLFQ
jgi:hypothetical protein